MRTPSIKTIILRITLIIAMAELIVMLMLGGISHDLSAPLEALLDALLLVSLSTPVIYIWVIKPDVIARNEARERALQTASGIQNAINKPVELRETFHLGTSIGIRILDDEKTTVDSLIKEADIAMYRAKQAGKGCAVVFE